MNASKKVLMIAYYFPPAGSVGVYRTLKFAKYLPEFGWTPIVLTVGNGKFEKYDESLTKLVPPGLRVYRSASFELFNEGENRRSAKKSKRRTLFSRMYHRLCYYWSYLTIPDNRVTWVPTATWRGLRIMKREGIRHVFITGKPFSSFIIGYLLKKITGARLLIDYRDPWTQNLNYYRRSRLHTWIEKKMESRIVGQSDVVISNTFVNERRMVEEFSKVHERQKFITIHNGFDSEDFDAVPNGKYEKFTITYAGVFYYSMDSDFERSAGDNVMRTYSPLYFLEALKKLFTERPEIKENVQVCFMGVLGRGYDPIIKEMGLDTVVKRIGYVEYDEHVGVLKKSHVLLLVLSRGEVSSGWVPSKFYQYMGSGNPILALAPEGEVREILRKTNAGISVAPDDVEAAAKAVADLYDTYDSGESAFRPDGGEVAKFERKHLTSILAKALDGS